MRWILSLFVLSFLGCKNTNLSATSPQPSLVNAENIFAQVDCSISDTELCGTLGKNGTTWLLVAESECKNLTDNTSVVAFDTATFRCGMRESPSDVLCRTELFNNFRISDTTPLTSGLRCVFAVYDLNNDGEPSIGDVQCSKDFNFTSSGTPNEVYLKEGCIPYTDT